MWPQPCVHACRAVWTQPCPWAEHVGDAPALPFSACSDKNVDFAAHSNTEDGGAVFLNLLGNLAFPLLLVGGLFLLSRRQGGGMGPGGPGNPLAFGKSRARFQVGGCLAGRGAEPVAASRGRVSRRRRLPTFF